MNILVVDLANEIDALIINLNAPRAFHSDHTVIVGRAMQLQGELLTALSSSSTPDIDQLQSWRAEMNAIAQWLVRYPAADADPILENAYEPEFFEEFDEFGASVEGDAGSEETWGLDQVASTSLPGDPVSETDPEDMPPRRPKR